ncbi:hypothetical protein CDAR_493001 [Caerostris darwini]|uniref:Uncharacterized protein n=1 Tax=Caerostris darwini TaxID=1538125 RepID=A0AAV4MXA8_9ARAC|nr:hypothetical protein CDAR_493001 [Caerostris darwini]
MKNRISPSGLEEDVSKNPENDQNNNAEGDVSKNPEKDQNNNAKERRNDKNNNAEGDVSKNPGNDENNNVKETKNPENEQNNKAVEDSNGNTEVVSEEASRSVLLSRIGQSLSKLADDFEETQFPELFHFFMTDSTKYFNEFYTCLYELNIIINVSIRVFLKRVREIFYNIRLNTEHRIAYNQFMTERFLKIKNLFETSNRDLVIIERSRTETLKFLKKILSVLDSNYARLKILVHTIGDIENINSLPVFVFNKAWRNVAFNEQAFSLLKETIDDVSAYWTCLNKQDLRFEICYKRLLERRN